MPSTLPLVLGALIFTGMASSVWRLLRAVMSRAGKPSSTGSTDLTALRFDAARELLWTILLLVHFVFIEALSESREVPETLAIAGSISGGLCLISALVSLASCISIERSLMSSR